MNTGIKLTLIATAVLIVISCGKKNKVAELEKLKKQQIEINEKIKQLEIEIQKEQKGVLTKTKTEVTVYKAEKQQFAHYIEVQGKVDGDENVIATAQTIGIIKTINVKTGDIVKKDQVLAELNDDVVMKSINELKSQLEFATNIYNKQKKLWDQKIGSEVQYLTAKNNKEALENKLSTLYEQLDMYKIKSPINGTIEDIPIKIGQSVSPGMPAFRIVNFSTVKITADISENYSGIVKKGNEVIVHFPDINKEIKEKISFKSRFINPTNRTFSIEIKYKTDDDSYFANMIAIVKIKDYSSDSSIVIPVNYIQKDNGNEYVYTVKQKEGNTYAKKTYVKTGKAYNGYIEVLEGLSEGEMIISSGYSNIDDEQLVTVKQ